MLRPNLRHLLGPTIVVIALSPSLVTCADEPRACNGTEALCGRPYSETIQACTHNAMSSAADGFIAPNQALGLERQMQDGIRALMLDVHTWGGEVTLCHDMCGLGQMPLKDALNKIRIFLETNPHEVLTLILESYVTAADLEAELRRAGLIDTLHAQPLGQRWPTLGAMVDSGRRLVIFADRDGGAFPWLHAVWTWAWETDYDNKTPTDFSCARHRGQSSNPLFILNHFLTNPIALPSLAAQVNVNPLLWDRLGQCRRESGRWPTFVAVDFYDVGDLLKDLAQLNTAQP